MICPILSAGYLAGPSSDVHNFANRDDPDNLVECKHEACALWIDNDRVCGLMN